MGKCVKRAEDEQNYYHCSIKVAHLLNTSVYPRIGMYLYVLVVEKIERESVGFIDPPVSNPISNHNGRNLDA